MPSLRFLLPVMTLTAVIAVGCGGTVVQEESIQYDDGGNPIVDSATSDALTDTRRRDAAVTDSMEPEASEPDAWVDPMCPDTPKPSPRYACDPLKPAPGDCRAGTACFPYVEYPTDPCEHEIYHAECFQAGTGKQGAACSDDLCAAGYACVASGSGNICVKMCSTSMPSGCPEGLVCQTTDVPGVGGCL